MGLFLDRFRLTLRLHPEFTEGLCDFDRSALWRSNYLLAGAICLSKVNVFRKYDYNKENLTNF